MSIALALFDAALVGARWQMLHISSQVHVAQFRAREFGRLPVALDERTLHRVLLLGERPEGRQRERDRGKLHSISAAIRARTVPAKSRIS